MRSSPFPPCCRCGQVADPLVVHDVPGGRLPMCEDCTDGLEDVAAWWASAEVYLARFDVPGYVLPDHTVIRGRDLVDAAGVAERIGATGVCRPLGAPPEAACAG